MQKLNIAVAALFLQTAAFAEVRVTSERNDGPAASPSFTFKSIPSPSRTDAAAKAAFSIIDGRHDANGGGVAALNDGRWAANADDPSRSFFFNAGTPGGRVLADLGAASPILAVTTYSWHVASRGPQVYRLYASDGVAGDFNAKPSNDIDPEKAGWKLIATVDTRAGNEPRGGQYGVSVADPNGAPLGQFRYLLFDVSATETRTAFGNTFFSEIDISDGKEHAPAAVAEAPAMPPEVVDIGGKYQISFDYAEMPELKPWIDARLKPVCVDWYPKIVEMLPSEGYAAPLQFTIKFDKDMRGVANAAGTRINCAGPWFSRNLEGEAVGAVVHEMVHVVQQYRRARGGNANPGWLVEGLADYIRWHLYEPENKRRRLNPERVRYTDSYHVTGAFLAHLEKAHEGIVRKLNAAMRHGKYSVELWKEYTGKTVDELWEDFVKTLAPR